MSSSPLVSVVCLCYNHADFVEQAIESVQRQTHKNIELIIIDDSSSDNSVQRIEKVLSQLSINFQVILNKQNIGNCKSFNLGLKRCKGEYVIDLAADDVLQADRIAEGLQVFEASDESYGIHYCDAQVIDADGKLNANLSHKPIFPIIFKGNIYRSLITRYWINPASMMMKKDCLMQLEGYDENLSYEDFDFWIRSARTWKYCYSPKMLVQKRDVQGSLGSRQQKFRNLDQYSTLKVCQKIYALNQSNEEDQALRKRIIYEMQQCVKTLNVELIYSYWLLYRKSGKKNRQST
ncbi:MAG: glycosyltransferase involved in cell wall biosynthesis [Cyclobacteriaceae bacterium]|jgi:glycosyltransferase involved in cell wall biosynthesis